MTHRRIYRGMRWLIGFPLISAMLLSVCLAGLLGTQAGRVWIAQDLLPKLAQKAGYQLQIESVTSNQLGDWSIGLIRFNHAEQALLEIRQLSLQWSPAEILNQHLSVQNLNMQQLTLHWPALTATASDPAKPIESPRQSFIALSPFPVTLGQFSIDEIQVIHPDLPDQQRYALNGNLALKPQGIPLNIGLEVRTLNGIPLSLSVQTEVNADEQARLIGHVHEPAGGLMGGWIRQSPDQATTLDFEMGIRETHGAYHFDFKHLTSHYLEHALSAAGDMRYQPNPQQWSWDLDLVTDQQSHKLQGEINRQQLQLNARLNDAPLDLLSPWLAQTISGTASVDLTVSGPIQSPTAKGSLNIQTDYAGSSWLLEATGAGSNQLVNFERLRINTGETELLLSGQVDLAQQTLAVRANSTAIPLSLVRSVYPELPNHSDGILSADLTITGPWESPHLSGNLGFDGQYQQVPLHVSIQGRGNQQQFQLEHLRLTTEQQGAMYASGQFDHDQLDFQIQAKALPSHLLSGFGWRIQPGQFNTDLRLAGTLDRPTLNGHLELDSTWRTLDAADEPIQLPIGLQADIQTTDQQLALKTRFSEADTPIGHIDLTLPLQRYLKLESTDSIPLQGQLSADLDLGYLRILLDPEEHKLGGKLLAELQLNGTIDTPEIRGQISLANAHYENILSGTRLEQIEAEIGLNNQELVIRQASARDDDVGTLTLSGKVDWSEQTTLPVQLTLALQQAQLLRRHDLEGTTSGQLSLQGDFEQLSLTGQLDISPFALYLDNLQSQSIPSLRVTEIDTNTAQISTSDSKPSSAFPRVLLDVTLVAEQQGFLRGQGLEAELSGKINLRGDIHQLRYAGQFRTLRGYYEVLGKKFTLKDGWARFEGDQVALFIPGVHTTKDAEIRAELSGTLDELALTLSSDPVMPQDEIISHLLFGRSARDISPLQAVRLAAAVNQLRTGGRSLFDPVEATRNLIGVDTISVDSSETPEGDGVTVGVGKYISEKVYLEVEKGSEASQPWKGSVEIEVTPNLSVESTTGGNSGLGGIELQWKHDY